MREKREHRGKSAIFVLFIMGLLFLNPLSATAAVTSITPSTWNIVGLDSNTPAFGPSRFPVGAMVCSNSGGSVPVTLTWDSANPYINLRAGSLNPVTLNFPVGGGCLDAFFEMEVTKNALAFDTTRRYHISAGSLSTPTPREVYVEHLISQGRNAVTNMEFGTSLASLQSVAAGGSMNLVVGNTYYIRMHSYTATQGYEQLENFVNFPNTVFRIISVETTYTADSSPYESSPNSKLYGDGCLWENDPNSPNYRSCLGDGKVGGTMTATYQVEIIGGGGGTESLNTLIHDFSGSSFHYNADFSTSARFANIIDPTNLTISKSFTPDPTNVNGVSTLTFTLTNLNAGAVSGVNFTDTFPTSPGTMKVATPPNATTSGCGAPTFAPSPDDASISFSSGTMASNSSCTVKVDVTTTATGTYTNTSNNLFVDMLDTGKTATDTLTVNNAPPPTPPVCGLVLAEWRMPATGIGSGGPPPPYSYKAPDVATATSSYTGGTNAISSAQGNGVNSWEGTGYAKTTVPGSGTPAYYELAVDSTNYTNVTITLDTYASANWVTSNVLYVWSSADGGAFSAAPPATGTLVKTTWSANQSFAAAITGATTTTNFRINAMGANSTGASMFLDNIVVTGCGIPDPPTMTKSFSLNPVAVNGTSTLTFTITNPNASVALNGVTFTDAMPAGLEVASTPNASTTCGGTPTWAPLAGNTNLTFGSPTGASVPANSSCTVKVDIKATTAGPHTNVSGFVTSTTTGANNAGSAGIASASLTAVSPPAISKLFAANPVLAGGTSTLTFTITNPNQNNALSAVSFTDTFPIAPGAMTVVAPLATSNTCGGTLWDNAGGGLAAGDPGIRLTGGALAAGGTCSVSVNITVPSTGTYNNTSGNVSHQINAATVNGNTASDSLTVNPANPQISLLKQVGTTATGPWTSFLAVTAGANVYYKFSIENAGDVQLSSIGINDPNVSTAGCTWTDPLPVAMGANSNHITTCIVGPVTAVPGSNLNTAIASGTYGATTVTDASSARYATSGISITKNAAETYFTGAGAVLNYSYTVSNSGFATLSGTATVTDDKSTDESCPALSTIGDLDNFFDPGESIGCTATYTTVPADVAARQVTNSATATIDSVTSSAAVKTVPLAADLTALKTNDASGSVTLGGNFQWFITVANSPSGGSSALYADTEAMVTDDLPSSGATYVLGTVVKSGVTGNINCSIAANTVTCLASGAVSIAPGLQGTITVANGSPSVTGSGTSFTTKLSAGSIILINGTPYAVLSVTDNTNLTLASNYAGANEAGVSVPASFTVPITVTPTGGASLVNPRSGGICRADSSSLVPEMLENNNDCANTVNIDAPNITVVKMVATYWDPINDFTSPMAIPGSLMTYTIMVTNSGAGAADNNTTVITDAIPANTEMFVGDFDGAGPVSGPVSFIDGASCNPGTAASGLSYSFVGLSDTGDNLLFSKNSGGSYDTPSDIPSGDYDSAVTHFKAALSGIFNGTSASGGSNTSFCLQFRVRVK